MKQILDLTVVDNTSYGDIYFVLKLTCNQPFGDLLPGQFASLKVDNNRSVFLRRPFSFHDFDKKTNTISFLIRIVGEGTKELSKLKTGDIVNAVMPLGSGFNTGSLDKTLLVGGGSGIAPMLFLAKSLKSDFDILLGGKTKQDLINLKEFENISSVFCTTEDGSYGTKGFVTEHSCLKNNILNYKRIYCCGPDAMMKAIANIARHNNIFCEVSLENTMACGFGVCLCCVTDTVSGRECVCTKGPVFNINDLKW